MLAMRSLREDEPPPSLKIKLDDLSIGQSILIHAGDHVTEGGRAVVQLEADSVAVDEGVDHVLGKEHDPWRAHGQDAPPLPVITIVINVANIMGEFEARRRTLLCVRVSRAAAQVSCY